MDGNPAKPIYDELVRDRRDAAFARTLINVSRSKSRSRITGRPPRLLPHVCFPAIFFSDWSLFDIMAYGIYALHGWRVEHLIERNRGVAGSSERNRGVAGSSQGRRPSLSTTTELTPTPCDDTAASAATVHARCETEPLVPPPSPVNRGVAGSSQGRRPSLSTTTELTPTPCDDTAASAATVHARCETEPLVLHFLPFSLEKVEEARERL